MISETIFSIYKSDRRSGFWLVFGLSIIGIASFFEKDGWQGALRIPLSLLTFSVIVVVMMDLLMWIFGRTKLGRAWYVLVVTSGVLLGVLSFFGNPLPLLLLAFLISGVVLVIGFVKSRL